MFNKPATTTGTGFFNNTPSNPSNQGTLFKPSTPSFFPNSTTTGLPTAWGQKPLTPGLGQGGFLTTTPGLGQPQ